MLKFLVLGSLLSASLNCLASPLDQMMTVKERLRIVLWSQGLEDQRKIPVPQKEKIVLPEEIERPLRKL